MTTTATQPSLFDTASTSASPAPFARHSTKFIQCPCNNNIIAHATTEPSPASIYGFQTVTFLVGNAKLDHFSNAVCICGRKHSIREFVSKFHKAAVKSGAGA